MAIELRIDDRKLRERIANSPAHAKQFLSAASEQVLTEWKLLMQRTSKGGKGKLRTKSGKMHFPSLPGNPPAIDYGNLINSLHHENTVQGGMGNPHTIGTPRGPQVSESEALFYGAEYGLYLDQDKNRPFIEKGLMQMRDNHLQNIAQAVWGE